MAKNSRFIDLLGVRFNRYLVIERAGTIRDEARWKCLCDCGNVRLVAGSDLRHGVKSCGCWVKDNGYAFHSPQARKKQGAARLGKSYRRISNSKSSGKNADWVKAVLKKDNYTCQGCGITKEQLVNKGKRGLHAHHIRDFDNYPELRFEVSNGRALCHDCHVKETVRIFKESRRLLKELFNALPQDRAWLSSDLEKEIKNLV